MIDQEIFNKFFNFEFDETDSYNFCTFFHEDEFIFKKLLLNSFPKVLFLDKINVAISNLKKLKDPDGKFFIKSLYYSNLIKKNISSGLFDEDFFKILLTDKDFEKNFYYLIEEIPSEKIFHLLKEIASRKNISIVEIFKEVLVRNSKYNQAKNGKSGRENNLDLSISFLSLDDVCQLYSSMLDDKLNNNFLLAPLRRMDRFLFSDESVDNSNNLSYILENPQYRIFEKVFQKSEDFTFYLEMQISNLFHLVILNKVTSLMERMLDLCRLHKDYYYIEKFLSNLLPKKTIFLSLLEINHRGSIDRFIEKNSHLDEVKRLMIYR